MNYDNWLTEPYEDYYYEAEKERRQREWLLEEIEDFDGDEEAIEDWLKKEGYDDPREQ